MILLYLAIILIVVAVFLFRRYGTKTVDAMYNLRWGALSGAVFTVVGAIFLFVFFIGCLGTNIECTFGFPQEIARAETLCGAIQPTVDAQYSGLRVGGALVGGALDNVGQSRAVSESIAVCAKARSEYNGNLANYQALRRTWSGKFLFWGLFVPKAVLDMKPLTGYGTMQGSPAN